MLKLKTSPLVFLYGLLILLISPAVSGQPLMLKVAGDAQAGFRVDIYREPIAGDQYRRIFPATF